MNVTITPAPQDITMKLLLLLALHGGAHASTRHKATKNAVDEATTQRLCIHGLEPLGFGEDPGNLRRNLRFGNSGGGNGCCFPFFPFGPIG